MVIDTRRLSAQNSRSGHFRADNDDNNRWTNQLLYPLRTCAGVMRARKRKLADANMNYELANLFLCQINLSITSTNVHCGCDRTWLAVVYCFVHGSTISIQTRIASMDNNVHVTSYIFSSDDISMKRCS